MTTTKDRFLGCLVGLAVGDALGAPYEWSKVPFKATKMIASSKSFHNMPVGSWTDDTSMALCLAESLIKCNGFNGFHQMITYLKWKDCGHLSAQSRCQGIGSTTRLALEHFSLYGFSKPFKQDESKGIGLGNGCIMRLAPVPMFYYNKQEDVVNYSRKSAVTTHKSTVCQEATMFLGCMIWKALNGYTKEQILTFANTTGSHKEIKEIIYGKTYLKEPPYIKGTGYVVKSLEAALWAFNKSKNFRHGALLAVNLGGDADTTAAIYGQLSGAYYGYNNIPKVWRKKLVQRKLIEDFALRLFQRHYNDFTLKSITFPK